MAQRFPTGGPNAAPPPGAMQPQQRYQGPAQPQGSPMPPRPYPGPNFPVRPLTSNLPLYLSYVHYNSCHILYIFTYKFSFMFGAI